MTMQLMLDDELYRAACSEAQTRGKSLSDFVADVLRRAVAGPASTSVRQIARNGVPVIVVPQGTPAINPSTVRQAIEEDGF